MFPTLEPRPLRRKAPWLSVVLIIVPRPPCQHSPVLAALLRESLLDLHRKGLLSLKCPPSTPRQALRGQPCSQLLRGSAGARGLEDWLPFAIASGAHGDALGAGHCPAGLPCASTGTSVMKASPQWSRACPPERGEPLLSSALPGLSPLCPHSS